MADAAQTPTSGGAQKSPVLQNTKTVYFEKKSDDGKTYSGDFTFKRLTIADVGRVGAEIARLNGGNPVDQTTEFINTMLAHFKFGIVSAPEWWNPNELYDLGIVREVFEAQMAHETSFRSAPGGQVSAPPPAS